MHGGCWGNPETASIWSQASLLVRNLIQFHVFVDGNKRVGIMSGYIFLFKNGWTLQPTDPEDMFNIPMQIAEGNLSLVEIALWLKQNSVPWTDMNSAENTCILSYFCRIETADLDLEVDAMDEIK